MRGERRRPSQVRLDDAETVLVESGLIDADYVGAQLGTTFGSVQEAARAAMAAGDVSPHPLFEAQWIGRRRSWQRLGQHPVLWYVSERRRRNRIAPHPLVDPRIIFATHPEARHHPYGALSYWLSVSTPGTALPTRILPRKVSWGTYRAAAIEAAAAWRREVVRGPASARRPDPGAPDRPGHLPRRDRRDGDAGRRPAGARDGRVAAGADLRRLAPGGGRPRLARRHRRRAPGHRRLRRPHHRGARVPLLPRPRPQRRPRARHRRARRLPPARSPLAARHAGLAGRPRPPLRRLGRARRGRRRGPRPGRAARRSTGRPRDRPAAPGRHQGRRRLRRGPRRVGRARHDAAALPRPRPAPRRRTRPQAAGPRPARPRRRLGLGRPRAPARRLGRLRARDLRHPGHPRDAGGTRAAPHGRVAELGAPRGRRADPGRRTTPPGAPRARGLHRRDHLRRAVRLGADAGLDVGGHQHRHLAGDGQHRRAGAPRGDAAAAADRGAPRRGRARRRAWRSRSRWSWTSTAWSSAPAPASPRSTPTPSSSSRGCRRATPYASGSAPSPPPPLPWSRCARRTPSRCAGSTPASGRCSPRPTSACGRSRPGWAGRSSCPRP